MSHRDTGYFVKNMNCATLYLKDRPTADRYRDVAVRDRDQENVTNCDADVAMVAKPMV